MGLCNRVVDDGAAEEAVIELGTTIVDEKSPQASRTIEAMLKPWTNLALVNEEMARDTTARIWASEEFQEWAAAFLAKEEQIPGSFQGTLPTADDGGGSEWECCRQDPC